MTDEQMAAEVDRFASLARKMIQRALTDSETLGHTDFRLNHVAVIAVVDEVDEDGNDVEAVISMFEKQSRVVQAGIAIHLSDELRLRGQGIA